MIASIALGLMLQQATGCCVYTGATSPPTGDTTGYWQQRVAYAITARLDETRHVVTARGTLLYVNNSPDTLREMFFHQYLNAFRPGSRWSAADARESRVRFQFLGDPDYGYERFTAMPVIRGAPVAVDYPGAPDSTVAHLRLPSALAPGDSLTIELQWEARPSTVFRRQGRRDRTYDLAQWYPKVAVYDRGGWEPNPLVPAGELYGEFGTYDVSIIARDDQVLGASGIPVSGDPGWARVSRTGPPRLGAIPGIGPSTAPAFALLPGERAVRFIARDVHHFAWTASPDYIYEGGVYTRTDSARHRYPTYDTTSVHVLYKPGDDTTWAGGRALKRTIDALAWLERLYGPFAYPQITNVHRLDRGATEFPMMIMDGSASYGLILHELGHNYTYGILANNEWRSAWMDEGLTDYQTYWAQRLAPQDNQRGEMYREPGRFPPGYRAYARTIPARDSTDFEMLRLELLGRAEPLGGNSADFHEFVVYNDMVYDRARMMYGHLRDLMGDATFIAFLHDYYERWALRHVDERAMRASAERAYGHDLGWFFDEWVRGTGLLDYRAVRHHTERRDSGYVTRVTIEQLGALMHPMPIGVHWSGGWVIGRAGVNGTEQTVAIVTPGEPDSVSIDPFHVTWDWDWRNNSDRRWLGTIPVPAMVFDWPFLDQANRSRTIAAVSPRAWMSAPQGAIVGVETRTNYLTSVDRFVFGLGVATQQAARASLISRFHVRLGGDNPSLPNIATRPLMGLHAGAAFLDGIAMADVAKRWDLSPFLFAPSPSISVTLRATSSYPVEPLLLPGQWSNASTTEVSGVFQYRTRPAPDGGWTTFTLDGGGGYVGAKGPGVASGAYARALASLATERWMSDSARTLLVRLSGGYARQAPLHRAIFASSRDPWQTFDDDYVRPRGALFKQHEINGLPLGGAGLRGYSQYLAFDRVVSTTLEFGQRVIAWGGASGRFGVWVGVFGDAGVGRMAAPSPVFVTDRVLGDAGVGALVSGRLYDRPVRFRIDLPFIVSEPDAGIGDVAASAVALRWAVVW